MGESEQFALEWMYSLCLLSEGKRAGCFLTPAIRDLFFEAGAATPEEPHPAEKP